jgi:CDP-glucose 4,6-dehydratase
MYAHSFGVPTGIVRCGNLFGGGDQNFSRLIPGVILATLNNESFCFRSDGSFICDFLYVEDAADAYMWLAERMAADSSLHGEAFNFGLQLRYSMLEVTEKVLSLMGRSDLRPLVQKGVTENSNEQTLDITKARERLRWRPKYGMEQGLKLTIEWYTRFATSASRETVACNTAVA